MAVAVQPLLVVTVTVYVPTADAVLTAVFAPFDQAYVTPGVVDDAVSVTLVFTQVNGPSFTADAFGALIFWPTVVVAVAVQPFAAVTVTVYTPDVLTVVTAVFAPFDQAYVTPTVVDDAVSVTLVFAQVNGPSFTADAFGGVIF
jgi:hypothetical protein